MSTQVNSPMPGRINQVNVSVGSVVSADETLFVLESMKMEINIPSPKAGTITEIHASAGAPVDKGALLAMIE